MRTIGRELRENRGIGEGFDFLRVFLSLSVLLAHSYLVVLGHDGPFAEGVGKVFHLSLIPMFFALSGFLITGSAMRLSLRNFLLNRGFRIIPALAMDIAISALLLGPLLTTWNIADYFSSYEFWSYFANLIGLIHYVLPGVFDTNPFPETVNGSLWTIPFELGCYALMAFLIVTGVIKRGYLLLGFVAGFAVALLTMRFFDFNPLTYSGLSVFNQAWFQTAIHHFTWPDRSVIYVHFLFGCLAYVFREKLPRSLPVAAFAFLLVSGSYWNWYGSYRDAITIIPLVYLTVFVGTAKIPPLPIFSRGDYSYGIYLYGYPLQQALMYLFPNSFSPLGHFVLSGLLVTCVAMVSWHCFEKPILQYRRKFSFTARLTGNDREAGISPASLNQLPPQVAVLEKKASKITSTV